jgi:hypothetical protein
MAALLTECSMPVSFLEEDGPYSPLAHDVFVEMAQMDFYIFFIKFDSCNRHSSSAPASLVPAR